MQKYKDNAQIIHIVHGIYKAAITPLLARDHLMTSSAATYLLAACNSAVNNASVQFSDRQMVGTTIWEWDSVCIHAQMPACIAFEKSGKLGKCFVKLGNVT